MLAGLWGVARVFCVFNMYYVDVMVFWLFLLSLTCITVWLILCSVWLLGYSDCLRWHSFFCNSVVCLIISLLSGLLSESGDAVNAVLCKLDALPVR